MSNEEVITALANLKTHTERLKHAVYDAWKKKNIGTGESGLILNAEALAGAKEAMNDKYGQGSVVW
jgi:hypothetical protein